LTEEDAGEEVHGAAVHPGGHLDGAGEDVARICATLPSPSLFEFRLAPCCILKVKWKGWDSPVDAIVLPHLDLNLLGGGYVGLLGEGDGALDVDHGLSGE